MGEAIGEMLPFVAMVLMLLTLLVVAARQWERRPDTDADVPMPRG